MTGLIIYKSKYGATAQYAEWLGEELALPVYPVEKVDPQEVEKAGYVLLGTSVYIGKMLIKKWLRRHAGMLKNKKIFMFIVCGSASADSRQHDAIINLSVPDTLRSQAEIVFLPGRLDKKKLSWTDRLMLSMGAMLEKDPMKKSVMRNGIDAVEKFRVLGLVKSVLLFTSGGESIPAASTAKIHADVS